MKDEDADEYEKRLNQEITAQNALAENEQQEAADETPTVSATRMRVIEGGRAGNTPKRRR